MTFTDRLDELRRIQIFALTDDEEFRALGYEDDAVHITDMSGTILSFYARDYGATAPYKTLRWIHELENLMAMYPADGWNPLNPDHLAVAMQVYRETRS